MTNLAFLRAKRGLTSICFPRAFDQLPDSVAEEEGHTLECADRTSETLFRPCCAQLQGYQLFVIELARQAGSLFAIRTCKLNWRRARRCKFFQDRGSHAAVQLGFRYMIPKSNVLPWPYVCPPQRCH